MAKVSYEFDLSQPGAAEELKVFQRGPEAVTAIQEFLKELRTKVKHGNLKAPDQKRWEEFRTLAYEFFPDFEDL